MHGHSSVDDIQGPVSFRDDAEALSALALVAAVSCSTPEMK